MDKKPIVNTGKDQFNYRLTSGTYEIATMMLTNYLSEERVEALNRNLQSIDHIENNLTIENLIATGNLSDEDSRICISLQKFEISPNRMTPKEAHLVNDFASNATPEIIDDKVNMIRDILITIINGVRNRRDYYLDEALSKQLRRLVRKGVQYERGEYDVSRDFDINIYPKDPYQSSELVGLGITFDDMSRDEFLSLIDTMSDDELIAGEYIDEDDFFRYGPYTIRDLRIISTFTRDTWARASDQRNYSRLESLLQSFIDPYDVNIDHDINRNYIEQLILPARRPNAKNIIALLSAFGQQCNEMIFADENTFPEALKRNVLFLKKALRCCSYYASHVCDLRGSYIKKVYKVAHPISKSYYQEILTHSEKWDDEQISKKGNNFHSYLNKIDEWLFGAQAAYVDIISAMRKSSRSETFITELLRLE